MWQVYNKERLYVTAERSPGGTPQGSSQPQEPGSRPSKHSSVRNNVSIASSNPLSRQTNASVTSEYEIIFSSALPMFFFLYWVGICWCFVRLVHFILPLFFSGSSFSIHGLFSSLLFKLGSLLYLASTGVMCLDVIILHRLFNLPAAVSVSFMFFCHCDSILKFFFCHLYRVKSVVSCASSFSL